MLCKALIPTSRLMALIVVGVAAGCASGPSSLATATAVPAAATPVATEPSAALFYPWQFEEESFEPAKERCGDTTVSDAMQTLATSSDDRQRRSAAYRLGECCFGSSFMLMRWSCPTREDRQAMIAAVRQGRVGTKAQVLVPVLIKALDDPSRDVRKAIAYSFVYIGPIAAAAAPRLRVALSDPDVTVRLWAARALHGITLESAPSLDTSLAALDDADPGVRSMAVYNLELMGRDAHVALARLRLLADSDLDEGVRGQAQQAISSLSQ